MVTHQNESKKAFQYSFQFNIEGNEVYLDHQKGIVKIVWEGRVDLDIADSLLSYTADLVEGGLINRILLDRQNLIHFEDKARKWIKNEFLETRCKELAHLIKKVAIVNETSIAAMLYGKKIADDIEQTFINLPIKKFDKLTDAEGWILND